MPKQLTRYTTDWETGRAWLKQGSTPNSAKCCICIKEFEIGGSGIGQVDSHARSKTHTKLISAQKSQSILKRNPFEKSFPRKVFQQSIPAITKQKSF